MSDGRPAIDADEVDLSDVGDEDGLHAIQAVADRFGVTTRALRFYETKGLIEPQRAGAMRVYTRRELGRLQLILRGKRLGFSIREIKEFLDLYDADPEHVEQMRRLAERAEQRIGELHAQKRAIDRTVAELREIVGQARDRLAASDRP